MTWLERRQRNKAGKLMARGEVSRAIKLLERVRAWDALVEAYRRQGKTRAAAAAAGKAGLFEDGAALFEEAGAYLDAAKLWQRASKPEQAAMAYEKAEDFETAARIYTEIGSYARAATALGLLDRYADAGELYERAEEPVNAVKMYRMANRLGEAARVLEQAGQCADAARHYVEGGDLAAAARLFRQSGELHMAAECHANLGEHEKAGQLLESGGYLLEAAEAFERDDAALEKAAELLGKVLRPEPAWTLDINTSPLCLCVADDGSRFVIGCSNHRVIVFDNTGEQIWSFRPPRGEVPTCVELLHDGRLAVGCDDRRLYLYGEDKELLWGFRLPARAVRIAVDHAGKRILCLAQDNVLLCLDDAGKLCWEHRAAGQVWDVDISADGSRVALATAAGTCVFLSGDGQPVAEYATRDWVHSVSFSSDGALCALGTGMQRVELLDVTALKSLWSAEESSWVHDVALTPKNSVLVVGDSEAVLRDEAGGVIWRCQGADRIMGGVVDSAQRFSAFRCVDQKIVGVRLQHCKARAAAIFERIGNTGGAASMYEEMGEHLKAAGIFEAMGDYEGAARNLAQVGRRVEAAEYYERCGDFDKAAVLFEAVEEFDKAAECFKRAGAFEKAAQVYQQAGKLEVAAAIFEQAGEYGKAGDLYRELDNTQAAIKALTRHVALHPQDLTRHMDLGVLMERNGQFDTAIEQFQKTADSERYQRDALKHMADCFAAKNMYEIAINRYQTCLKDDEQVTTHNLDVYYGMAKAYEMARNYAEAKRIYEHVLAVNFQYRDVQERIEEVNTLAALFAGRTGTTSASGQATIGVSGMFQSLSFETRERYGIKKLLGKGGMGEVYLAEDKRLKRTVALKILPAELAADEQLRLRMIREAQAVAQIAHPNVVAVYDVGEEAGRSYISMEYVDGPTLRSILKERERLDLKEVVPLLQQITEGLGCAHEKGVTHRDIKPENVIMSSDGTAKIMDFGLAVVQGATRMTVAGGVSGTWRYMAPEQVRGEVDLTAAVDVYAVGCVAYELITGKPPFVGDDVGVQHLTADPKALSEIESAVPAEVSDVIMKCLNKEPGDRYPDAMTLNEALVEVESGL